METYSFDEIDEARLAVQTAMAEAGCYGPAVEEQCAGMSLEKNLISSFIRWREKITLMRMSITVTQGLGKYLSDILREGGARIPERVMLPTIKRIDKAANWVRDEQGIFKRYGSDTVDDVVERICLACEEGKVVDISEDGENIVEADLEDLGVDLDVLALSEQVQLFNIHFHPCKKD
jgi:hypothetical protein|tara:strand:+ start:1026 stop:1556 length:531 start_codon:yes stop_codon:yes gene_type:complete